MAKILSRITGYEEISRNVYRELVINKGPFMNSDEVYNYRLRLLGVFNIYIYIYM